MKNRFGEQLEDLDVHEPIPYLVKQKQEVKKGEEPPIETQEDPMPQLITDCMNALFERGMNPTERRVRTCIEDRCKDENEYNECMNWLNENMNIGGI